MRRGILVAGLVLCAGLLAWQAASGTLHTAEALRLRYQQRVDSALDALEAELAVQLENLPRAPEALPLRADSLGLLARPPLPAPTEDSAALLLERAALQRPSRPAAAESLRLRVEALPDRDARGLALAHAARCLRAEAALARGEAERALALWTELLPRLNADAPRPDQWASLALLRRLRDGALALRDQVPGAAFRAWERADSLAWQASRPRRLLAARALGTWLQAGAPGGGGLFPLPADPAWPARADTVVAVAWPEGRGLTGAALELGGVAARLAASRTAGNLARLGLGSTLAPLGDTARAAGRRRLQGTLEGLELQVRDRDAEAFLAAERARLEAGAWLLAGGIALLVLLALALARAVRRELRAARQQANFVAAVSHELKAPLASIRLLGELLERGGVEEEKAREFAGRIVGESTRLARTVGAVLDLARIERGLGPVRRERLDLAASLEPAFDGFRLAADGDGFALALQVAPALPAVIGDPDALSGAVWNLLDNARKHADSPHTIEVELGSAGGGVFLAVRDRGRGVPPEARASIFEPFARAGDELTRDRPGVGLGLALARRVAEGHGGSLRYAPRAGGGSVFRLELPAEEG